MKKTLIVFFVMVYMAYNVTACKGNVSKVEESDVIDIIQPQEGVFDSVVDIDNYGGKKEEIYRAGNKKICIHNGYGEISPWEGIEIEVEYEGADVKIYTDEGYLGICEGEKWIKNSNEREQKFSDSGSVFWYCDRDEFYYYVDQTGEEYGLYGADITIILEEKGHIIAAAFLNICVEEKMIWTERYLYYATLEKAVSFPKIEGKYQNVTEEYIKGYFEQK